MNRLATIEIESHPNFNNVKRTASVTKMILDSEEIKLTIVIEHYQDNGGLIGYKLENIDDVVIEKSTLDTYINLSNGMLDYAIYFNANGEAVFSDNSNRISEYEYWKAIPLSFFNLNENSTVFNDVIRPIFLNTLGSMNTRGVFNNIYNT